MFRRLWSGAGLIVAAVTVAPAQSPPSAGTAAVSGVVTDSATLEPIAGVVVSIRRLGVQASVREQVTDAKGRFVFDELIGSKQYVINAMKPGYANAEYRRGPGQSPATMFALEDGQWISSARLSMDKLGAIGGFVTDEFGEPVVGAFVRAIAEISVAGSRALASGPVARTDDRGEYRLAGLLAARYFVMLPSVQQTVPAATTPAQIEGLRDDTYQRLQTAIERNPSTPRSNNGAIADGDSRLIIGNYVTPPATDGPSRAYPSTYFPGTALLASASAVDLAAGEDRSGVNFSLQPVPVVSVTGRVDGMTEPARLTLRLYASGLDQISGGEAASTIVNPDGTFTFLGVPAGEYILETRQSRFQFELQPVSTATGPFLPSTPGRELLGWQVGSWFAGPRHTTYAAVMTPPGPSYFGRIAVTVGSINVKDLLVKVQPVLTIRGRFVYEDMTPPARPLMVIAEPVERRSELGMAGSRSEDGEKETFTIHSVAPGRYNLRATPGPTAAFVLKSIVFRGLDYVAKPVDAGAGSDLTDVVITFTGKPAVLAGTVRDDRGEPADSRHVMAFPVDRTVWPVLGLNPLVARVLTTASDGSFSLSTLPAGEYYVVAVRSVKQDWTDPAFLSKAAALATRITVEWATSRSVALTEVVIKQ